CSSEAVGAARQVCGADGSLLARSRTHAHGQQLPLDAAVRRSAIDCLAALQTGQSWGSNAVDPADKARLIDNPPYRAESPQPTRVLLTQIVAVASDEVAGPTRVDAEPFDFPRR
ncbi:MAG TPA: hypothetical protein VGK95_11215, partial [Caldimonas sp.]